MDLSTGTILFFCGRFIVETDKHSHSSKGLSKRFDIGLNFFMWRRETKEVVPDFIRYLGTAGSNYGKALVKYKFQLSYEAIEIIKNYKKAFPMIFDYVDKEVEKNKQSIFGLPRFEAYRVFKGAEDCNMSLVHAYVWVI